MSKQSPAILAPPKPNLRLSPNDHLWVAYREHVTQPKPIAKPFDREAALARLKKVTEGQYGWEWHKAQLKPPFSKEEAHFWLTAFRLNIGDTYNKQVTDQNAITGLQKMAAFELTDEVSVEDITDCNTSSRGYFNSTHIVSLLLAIFPPLEALKLILRIRTNYGNTHPEYRGYIISSDYVDDLRRYMLPYLSLSELEEIRGFIRPKLEKEYFPVIVDGIWSGYYNLAAVFGLSDILEPKIAGLTDSCNEANFYRVSWNRHQELVFALGSAEAVVREMKRLNLPFNDAGYVTAWLGHSGFSELDYAVESILMANKSGFGRDSSPRELSASMIRAFAAAEAPEVAPHMLRLSLEAKSPAPAVQWLDKHPEHAIWGLIPVATGKGKLATAALQQLRVYVKRGLEEQVEAAISTLPEPDLSRLKSQLLSGDKEDGNDFTDADLPSIVKDALTGDPKLLKARTGWVSAADLPPITIGSRRLAAPQIEALLSALQQPGHAYTAAIKSTADTATVETFVWDLFQLWLKLGAPTKGKWTFSALGEMGGDRCAIRLTPQIHQWAKELKRQKASLGLECLVQIGSDTALSQLSSISQKVRYEWLQNAANSYLTAIAEARGLTREQLDDYVVPDCCLDERGTRIFDYGPRQFQFVLSEDLKPMVRLVGTRPGPAKPNLPAANSKDDPAKVESASADWKLLKKQISEASKIQVPRLEQAMVRGRHWSPADFQKLLVKHPLLSNFIRRLVWQAIGDDRSVTFRVTEDGTYADATDKSFALSLDEWTHVSLAHPLHLSESEKRAWGELLTDYELVPPFSQIGRPIYGLEPAEKTQQEITRFERIRIHPHALTSGLEKQSWVRGPAQDGGCFSDHYKYFESADTTACISYGDGLFIGDAESWEPQVLKTLIFLPGRYRNSEDTLGYLDPSKAILLSEVDPVVLSESLKDVAEIAAKGFPV